MKKEIGVLLGICMVSTLWGCGVSRQENPAPEALEITTQQTETRQEDTQQKGTQQEEAQKISNDMKNVEERDYAMFLIVETNDEEKEPDDDPDDDDMFEAPYEFTVGISQERRVGEKTEKETVSQWECEDLTALAKVYQEEKGKDLSLAHLKVILVEAEDTGYVEDARLLEMLEQNEEIAKTVPMLLLEDEDDFMDHMKDLEEPVGTDIENVVKAKNQEGKKASTVADYLRAWREKEQMDPDYLVKVKEGFRIKS